MCLKTCQGIGNTDGRISRGNSRRRIHLDGIAHGVSAGFESSEIEKLVLDDVSAGRESELFQLNRGFRLKTAIPVKVIEEVSRIKRVRAAKRISRAVNLVGA